YRSAVMFAVTWPWSPPGSRSSVTVSKRKREFLKMDTQLSPWWRRALILLMLAGFSTLGYLAARTYRYAPPIPGRVVGPGSKTLFTRQDILAGQQIFLSHGLMENGSIWGHGAYLGPDFSAEYLHTMALGVQASASTRMNQSAGAAHPN